MADVVITKYVDKKLVSVNHSGPIYPMGGIYGPTLPQITDVSEIAILIQKGYPVVEHLKNGSEVKLDIANFNIDLSGDEGAYLADVKGPNEDVKTVPTAEEKAAAEAATTATTDATKSTETATASANTVTATAATASTDTTAKTADTSATATAAKTAETTTTKVVVSTSASKADEVTSK